MDWGTVLQAGAQIADKAIPYVIDNHWKHRAAGMAYDFAKNQIQWRVEDAKKAGLHPLYALGATPITPSAQLVGGQASGGLGFTEAFNTVVNSKYEKELQRQTLEMNQLKIDGQKMANQIAYLESVKPVRPMGQAPLTSSNVSNATPSVGNLAKDIEPRYALNPIEARPNVYKMGPSTQGWLQDAISEFGIGTIPEQARYLLNNETVFGMKEYEHLADIFNSFERKKGTGSVWIAVHDAKYGPVLLHEIKNNPYNLEYYYGENGRFKLPRDRFTDFFKKAYNRFNRKFSHSDYELSGLYGD